MWQNTVDNLALDASGRPGLAVAPATQPKDTSRFAAGIKWSQSSASAAGRTLVLYRILARSWYSEVNMAEFRRRNIFEGS